MQSADPQTNVPVSVQFSLRGLLGYVTICSILAALFSWTGTAAGICLMLMVLALQVKNGPAALMMLVLASAAADLPLDRADETALVVRQVSVIAAAFVLCFCRRNPREARGGRSY